ncbi:MAG: hypothetical protein HY904_26530 [Deltaproteobacteria bacterium]|nr:hypothetical protein [Deltaproteobacteria bacterium]
MIGRHLWATAALLGATLAAAGCDDEFACQDDCDASVPDAGRDAGAPATLVVAAPLVLVERPIAGGSVTARLVLEPAHGVDAPATLPGGFFLPPAADLFLALDLRSTSAVVGARVPGEFAAWLRVDAVVTGLDQHGALRVPLSPVVGIADGMRYARNLRIREDLGLSGAGYDVRVAIRRPAWAGDPDTEASSPGLVREADILGGETGTLLGEVATTLTTHFTLEDLATPPSAGGGAPGTPSGGATAGGGQGYIAP